WSAQPPWGWARRSGVTGARASRPVEASPCRGSEPAPACAEHWAVRFPIPPRSGRYLPPEGPVGVRLAVRSGVGFAAFRKIWPAPAVALAVVLGGAAVPASADTPVPLPLPGITVSLPGITLSLNAPVPLPSPSVGVLEATLLTKLNAERTAGGLSALKLQPWASSVARAHSQEMAGARDIWHNHTGYLDIARQAIGASLTGENVAEAGTLDETDSLLMNSPPHRANILYPAFNYVGIGVALDAVGYVYVTQDFVTIKRAPPAVVATRTKGTPARASPAAPAAPG